MQAPGPAVEGGELASSNPDSTIPSPSTPRRSLVGHDRRLSSTIMQRTKRSSSRITDGATSRASDEDAKTAVKVAVRVRPPLQPTDPGFDLIPQRFRESTCDVPTPTNLSVQSPQGRKLFVFDRVFNESTKQDAVWEYLSDSVSSFVKGYNVSILAYGQSGAGKSYTMGTSGPEDQYDPNIMGIVPRAARALFEKLGGHQVRQTGIQTPKRYSTQALPSISGHGRGGGSKNWELKASYVEIYNEQLRDLLLPDHIPQSDRSQVAIREDTRGRILLTGLTQLPINSVDDLLNALNFGSAIRQTDATAINARSSRSHAVFSLNLVQKRGDSARPSSPATHDKRTSTPTDSVSGENVVTIDSKLHFVDLAGSERLKNTGATGDRAKEGIAINAGLASLGKVISQLSSKQSGAHISYRDSRLTRLLQDSLGGNAITFMVACVTPAVFHLSETLNTVHYAQRARAIQSKPEIQQSQEDGDKQAAIERLRAEVAFLRDQIRHADQSDRKGFENGRTDRLRGREADIHQQLMDMQEGYNALRERHAKLISELSKAREGDSSDTPLLKEAIGENAIERIKRSSSFAEAVEQMVMEYEKTIQSLESSLSKTRSSLSNSESTLLERETRIAYLETIQQQLQSRVQKAMDREQTNESYLRDLETRMEGTASGEEQNSTVIAELRKEIDRLREGESGAEDYITTLEERLAEAEQDQEIMQREIDRLEHVVERQRSIGRLDNLLGELDGMKQNGEPGATKASAPPEQANGRPESYDPFRPDSVAESFASANEGFSDTQTEKGLPDEADFGDAATPEPASKTVEEGGPFTPARTSHEVSSPAQNDFMADKVENLTQELFDLRSEHEANLIDYEKLQQKYQTALETLAKMEYGKEKPKEQEDPGTPTPSRPTSFLVDAGMRGEEKVMEPGQPSSSRSLSAELSSHGISHTTISEDLERERQESSDSDRMGGTMDEFTVQNDQFDPKDVPLPADEETDDIPEMRSLRTSYQNLAQRHQAALAQVEGLKSDLQRAQLGSRPMSSSYQKPVPRRKSDDVLQGHDRASRSFASLKNIALESFDENPDTKQTFEQNLNTVMTELHSHTERTHSLEAELATVRKELESKQTIIAGLTRERSSLAASSGVDFSIVGQMRDQLMESENQIRSLHEQNAQREQEFHSEIESLRASLNEHQKSVGVRHNSLPTSPDESTHMPGDFPETPALDTGSSRELGAEQAVAGASAAEGSDSDVARLQRELAAWESKHNDAMESMKASETKLLKTIHDLEESMSGAQRGADTSTDKAAPNAEADAASASFEEERNKHREVVDALQREVDQYRSTSAEHVAKLGQLEKSYASIMQQVDDDSKSRDLSQKELQTHRDLVSNLENQLHVHKSAITMHQDTLESLQASHSKEMEGLKSSMDASETESKQRLAELEEHHGLVVQNMQADLTEAQNQVTELLRGASAALGYETDPKLLHGQIKGLVDEGKELHSRHIKSTNELKAVQEELQNALNNTVNLENRIGELKSINEDALTNLEKLSAKEKKSARLVEELEDQLNNNFDSHQQANNRLSAMQSEAVQVRMDLERELEEQKMRNSHLEQQIDAVKRQSAASSSSVPNHNRESLSPEAAAIALARSSSQASTRKSGVQTALPAPPPSIPLPPLPGTPGAGTPTQNGLDRATSPVQTVPSISPPGSRHTSKDVGPNLSQVIEEQEARIRTIEKHLFAEKQLTATLEEALVDLETSANRTKSEMEGWRKKCNGLEDELVGLRKDNSRASLQAVEEEREMRMRAERARQALEQRMMELNQTKKKKKNALNCF
ncbi:kinesin-domain-containing protein [Hortaea werneckii]|nr:kinesin-domain-containing protein [Hortaea werneckii]KAI7311061.1 kinesin-domain-containing protein [Hortaea werneckii]